MVMIIFFILNSDGMSFTWKNGRWLSTTTLSDGTKITYRYNANEMRTQKKSRLKCN